MNHHDPFTVKEIMGLFLLGIPMSYVALKGIHEMFRFLFSG